MDWRDDGRRACDVSLSLSCVGVGLLVVLICDACSKLELSRRNLRGKLPASLNHLTRLTYECCLRSWCEFVEDLSGVCACACSHLDVSFNNVCGAVPDIRNLIHLRY
jgi:hypothetical protein